MKRLISVVLLLAMIFCCTACGGNQEFSNNMEGAGNSPSGTIYTDSQGHTVTNLGAHEHWCNSTEKLYSRNLGKDEGIELIRIMK